MSVALGRRAAGDQIGLDALAQRASGWPTTAHCAIGGMRQQRVLDLLAADLDAAGVDDVVDAAGDPEIIVGIEPPEIAAAPPAVAEFFPRQLRILPVADRQRRAGDRDLAGLAMWRLRRRSCRRARES